MSSQRFAFTYTQNAGHIHKTGCESANSTQKSDISRRRAMIFSTLLFQCCCCFDCVLFILHILCYMYNFCSLDGEYSQSLYIFFFFT